MTSPASRPRRLPPRGTDPIRAHRSLTDPAPLAAHALLDGLAAYQPGPDGQVDIQAAVRALDGLSRSGAVKVTPGPNGQPKVEIGGLVYGTMVIMGKLLDELCRAGNLDREEVLFDLHGYVDAPNR